MRLPLLILLFIRVLVLGQLTTSNLVLDLDARVGVTSDANGISAWLDNHNVLNNTGVTNTVTQTTNNYKPLFTLDPDNNPCVMFNYQIPSSSATSNILVIPDTMTDFHTRGCTVYVVSSGMQHQGNGCVIKFGGPSYGWLRIYGLESNPSTTEIVAGSHNTKLYPPCNKAVYAISGGASSVYTTWNGKLTETYGSALASNNIAGGTVGWMSGEQFAGLVYRVLVYTNAHSSAQVLANAGALAVEYSITTNHNARYVCRGDSLTEGLYQTNMQSWPFMLAYAYPEFAWYPYGKGSRQVGSNGVANTMYTLDASYLDKLYTNTTPCYLLFSGGINDILNGRTGAETYQRITNYTAARKAAGWDVYVFTVTPFTSYNSDVITLNNSLRTSSEKIIDIGLGSALESRLLNQSNTVYFNADKTHLTVRGTDVFTKNAAFYPSVKRRQ